jgi:hypothetical protein
MKLCSAFRPLGGVMRNTLEILASIGLALGAVFGLAGSVVGDAILRSLFWGVDGAGLVMAAALLTLKFHRQKSDLVAAGFLVLTAGEAVILSGSAMTLEAAAPSFAAGAALWATALFLISVPPAFPATVRGLGVITGFLFAATALMILSGQALTPLSRPLPYFAYPLFVLTIIGWIITILSRREPD